MAEVTHDALDARLRAIVGDARRDMIAEARSLLGSGFVPDYYEQAANGFALIAQYAVDRAAEAATAAAEPAVIESTLVGLPVVLEYDGRVVTVIVDLSEAADAALEAVADNDQPKPSTAFWTVLAGLTSATVTVTP